MIAQRTSDGTKVSILVVDDNDAIRAVIGRVLRRAGYRVTEARDGIEALQLPGHPFDLVILDMRMPGIDGESTGEAIRVRHPATRFVFVSGADGVRAPAWAGGFLAKPFTPPALTDAVTRALGGGET